MRTTPVLAVLFSLCAGCALVSGCAGDPPPIEHAAFEACGCGAGLECATFTHDPGFFQPSTSFSFCTVACGADAACRALDEDAYCAASDRCVLPCASDADCPVSTRCAEGGICGGPGDGESLVPTLVDLPGPRVALGGVVTYDLELEPCVRPATLRAEAGGAIEVIATEAEVAACSRFVSVTVRATELGAGRLAVWDRETLAQALAVEVVAPARLAIGVGAPLFDPGYGRADVDAIVGERALAIAFARDEDDARLAIGEGASWSVEDAAAASIEPLIWGDTSIVALEIHGPTTLRVRVGDLERAIAIGPE